MRRAIEIPGRVNKAHEYSHEQRIGATYKGVAGRRDEMSVWGLEGRIHTEAVMFDETGSPISIMAFTKDGAGVETVWGTGRDCPIPCLPNEKVIATHASAVHIDYGSSGDSFQLWLTDGIGTLLASSPVIAFGAGSIGTNCWLWNTPWQFLLCDQWGLTGFTTGGLADDVQIRVLVEFVALKGDA